TVAVESPKGDVNGDGTVNIADATMVFRYVSARVALNEEQLARADVVAPTGNVNIGDALVLFRYANGRLASL
ncbi:MAG: dockerin type I repeat-containing protein, partial [Clostridia bacterium]|nr:dockerin type I repeat-containing protein [Clostridia bacterium]